MPRRHIAFFFEDLSILIMLNGRLSTRTNESIDNTGQARDDPSVSRQRGKGLVSDFSSAEYWWTRFRTETTFEWLIPSSKVIPLVLDHIGSTSRSTTGNRGSPKGLHIGCGTSSLGRDVEQALREDEEMGSDVEVVDADYVADSIRSDPGSNTVNRILSLDCLYIDDLRIKSPEGGWDFILDKSTADAISCGPLISRSPDLVSEPLEILLRNLGSVTKQSGVWISISYSPTRFHVPYLAESGWEVVEKRFLASTSLPEGRRVSDGKGGERVVWEPETGVWGWVLRRT